MPRTHLPTVANLPVCKYREKYCIKATWRHGVRLPSLWRKWNETNRARLLTLCVWMKTDKNDSNCKCKPVNGLWGGWEGLNNLKLAPADALGFRSLEKRRCSVRDYEQRKMITSQELIRGYSVERCRGETFIRKWRKCARKFICQQNNCAWERILEETWRKHNTNEGDNVTQPAGGYETWVQFEIIAAFNGL